MSLVVLVGYNLNSIDPKYRFYTLAPFILKAYLKQHQKISQEDVQIKQFYLDDDTEKISNQILSDRPAIVGFSTYVWSVSKIIETAKKIKKKSNDIIIVVGGPQASYNPNILLRYNFIDVVVLNEAEDTFFELISLYLDNKKISLFNKGLKYINGLAYKKNSKIFVNPKRSEISLKDIPSCILDKRLFKEAIPNHDFAMTFETSRGCPFSCNYCVWGGKKLRFFPLDRIKKELLILLKIKRLKRIYFADSNLFVDEKRALEIIGFIAKNNKLKILIHFELNPTFLTKKTQEIIKKFKYGIYDFGIQTLNPNSTKLLNRKINYDGLLKKLGLLKGLGKTRNIWFSVIYCLPGDTLKGFVNTLDSLIDLEPRRITTGRLLLLPGSEFAKNPIKYGIISKKENPFVVDYTTSFTKNQIEETLKLIFYMNLFFGSKMLQRVIICLTRRKDRGNPPRYTKQIVRYFDYLQRYIDLTSGKSYEMLEESSPGSKKVDDYETVLSRLRGLKVKIIWYSLIFFMNDVIKFQKQNI